MARGRAAPVGRGFGRIPGAYKPPRPPLPSFGPSYNPPGPMYRTPPTVPAPAATPSVPAPGRASVAPQTDLQRAQTLVDTLLSGQQGAVDSVRKQMAAEAAARAQAIQAAYAAYANLLRSVAPQTQQTYQNAATDQAAFGKGFSSGLQDSLSQDASQANALLATLGAPAGQQIGPDRATQAGDVLYGTGGYIPSTALNREGAAFTSAAQLLPGTALGRGLQESLLSSAQSQNAINDFMQKSQLGLAQQRSGLLASTYGNIQSQKAAAARSAGQVRIFGSGSGGWFALNPSTGKLTQLTGPNAAAKPPKTFTGPDGAVYAWQQTKDGNWSAVPMTGPRATKPAAAKPPSTFKGPNGSVYVWRQTPTGWDAVPVVGGAKANKPVSAAVIKSGWDHIKQAKTGWWAITSQPDEALTISQLRTILARAQPIKIIDPKTGQEAKDKSTGKPLTRPWTVGDLPNASDSDMKRLGLAYYYGHPQEVYLDLVHSGIPARRAWQMVRKSLRGWQIADPNWGKDYFKRGGAEGMAGGGRRALATNGGILPNLPLGYPGKVIGVPYQGSHTLFGNWESDNAIDIAAPVGTPVYAVTTGTIGSQIGALSSRDPHLEGLRLHLDSGNNGFYYAHLSKIVVQPGQHVQAGQLLGYSGSANGTAHLHFAAQSGNPLTLLGLKA